MTEDMGTFRVEVEVENPVQPGRRVKIAAALVDSGLDFRWFLSSA
jgi:hypothetical protein